MNVLTEKPFQLIRSFIKKDYVIAMSSILIWTCNVVESIDLRL